MSIISVVGRRILLLILIAAPHFPLLVLLGFGTHLALAHHESGAYRFGFVTRLLDAEQSALWLPQGFVTSLIQKQVAIILRIFTDYGADFVEIIKTFSGATVVINGLILLGVQIVIVRDRGLEYSQRLILLTLPVVMTLSVKWASIWYWTSPDYYAFNITSFVLIAYVGTKLLLYPEQYTDRRSALRLGALVGLMVASKISFVFAGLALFLPLMLMIGKPLRALWFATIGTMTSVGVFMAIVILLYYPSLDIPFLAAPAWWHFLQHPGQEFNDLSEFYVRQLKSNNYLPVLIIYAAAFAVLLSRRVWRRSGGMPGFAAGMVAVRPTLLFALPLFASAWTLTVRTAGTTTFEVFGFISAAVIGLAASTQWSWNISVRVVLAAALSLAAVSTYPVAGFIQLAKAHARYDFRQATFERLRRLPHPVILIVPDNRYIHQTFEGLLIKAFSDIPAWNIKPDLPSLIRLFRTFRLRSENTWRHPNLPYAGPAYLVWYGDRNEVLLSNGDRDVAWLNRYPLLNEALNRPGTDCVVWKSNAEKTPPVTVCFLIGQSVGQSVEGSGIVGTVLNQIVGQQASLRSFNPAVTGKAKPPLLPLPGRKNVDKLDLWTNAWGHRNPRVRDADAQFPSKIQVVYPDVPRSACKDLLVGLSEIRDLVAVGVEGQSSGWREIPVDAMVAAQDCGRDLNAVNMLHDLRQTVK